MFCKKNPAHSRAAGKLFHNFPIKVLNRNMKRKCL